jgi:hypothetical protein
MQRSIITQNCNRRVTASCGRQARLTHNEVFHNKSVEQPKLYGVHTKSCIMGRYRNMDTYGYEVF